MRPHIVLLGLPMLAIALGCGADPASPPQTPTTTASPAPTAAIAPPEMPANPTPGPAGNSTPSPEGRQTTAVDAAKAELAVGKPAPDFTANDQNGHSVHLAALQGKSVVVYFYPKDETPGCTKEACAFRDAWNDLSKKGVVLIGVSSDSDQSHKAFAQSHKLPFLLVSDTSHALADKFGVPVEGGYEKRQSFVIGPDGNVRKIYRKVDVTVHAAEIAADVQ